MRNKDVTRSVAAVATELKDLSDISDNTFSGTQLHNLRIHSPIIATPGDALPKGRVSVWPGSRQVTRLVDRF